ncbi:MAG TPA: hypothetical protein PK765_01795 [bacterium]|nr:hypothetical protein [bacterium]
MLHTAFDTLMHFFRSISMSVSTTFDISGTLGDSDNSPSDDPDGNSDGGGSCGGGEE